MPRYVIYKKIRHRDGHISREHYLEGSSKSVKQLIHSHAGAGNFVSGDYVVFTMLKNGGISKAGKPFTFGKGKNGLKIYPF